MTYGATRAQEREEREGREGREVICMFSNLSAFFAHTGPDAVQNECTHRGQTNDHINYFMHVTLKAFKC